MADNNDELDQQNHSNRSCDGVRQDLKQCLWNSDCVKKEGKTPRQCLIEHSPNIDEECYQLKYLFFECKRSLIDARQRFRGRRGY